MFGDRAHLVALLDYNANGVYNDPDQGKQRGDRILIDYNDDGKFENFYRREDEVAYVGKYLYVDGIYWGISVAPDGASITVTRPEVTTGKLQVDEPSVAVWVVGGGGKYCLRRSEADEPFLLPVGSYRVEMVEARRRDRTGAEWSIRSSPGRGPLFEITAEKLASIKIGVPLKARARPRKQEGRVDFDLVIKGEDGLTYLLQRNGMDPQPPPRLAVKARQGDWAKSYSFRYG